MAQRTNEPLAKSTWSHLAGQIPGGDHVDAGNDQQQNIGRLHQQCGDFGFCGPDLPGFLPAILVQGQAELPVQRRLGIGRRRGAGPGEDPLEGARLRALAGVLEHLAKTVQPGLVDGLGGGEVAGDGQRPRRGPKVPEQGVEARQGGLPVLLQLAADRGSLLDQAAAQKMPIKSVSSVLMPGWAA